MHACVHLYADTWLIFYPVTRFLSPRPREQTDGSAVIKFLSSWRQKSDLPAPISHPVCFFFAFFYRLHSGWVFLMEGGGFVSSYATNVHVCSDSPLSPSLTHVHTPMFHSSIHSLAKDKRQGAEQQQQQQQWCSADPSAVGLTHVAGQTKRETNRARIERGERRGELVVLSNPPPGWPRVKYCTASSDTGN